MVNCKQAAGQYPCLAEHYILSPRLILSSHQALFLTIFCMSVLSSVCVHRHATECICACAYMCLWCICSALPLARRTNGSCISYLCLTGMGGVLGWSPPSQGGEHPCIPKPSRFTFTLQQGKCNTSCREGRIKCE